LFQYQSIQHYHTALLKNSTTCQQAVEFYLQQIANQKHLNAFVNLYGTEAINKAKQLDEKRKQEGIKGKLHGVVVGIKDVLCYKNHPVTAASQILQGFTATYNATAIQKLVNEEAIIVGSLNCDEFAMGSSNENSFYGKTLNAFDNERVPGGSSGGSAVAVQAGLCMVSLGSDTGGSVRQPADFCGIVGLKPTYGRISRYGLLAYASSFDQIGIFSNNFYDAAAVLEVIAGEDNYDSTVSLQPVDNYTSFDTIGSSPKKFAYFPEALEHPSVDKEIATSLKSHFNTLRNLGHTVEPVSFKFIDYIVPAYYVLTTAEASSNLSRYDGVKFGQRSVNNKIKLDEFYKKNRSQGFGNEVKKRIMLGTFVLSAGYFDAYFTRAQQVRQELIKQTALIFKDFDAILLPTVPFPAFKFGEMSNDPLAMYLADIFTVYANLVGIPAISIPAFKHSNGMPFGLQAMTNRFQELSLLHLSHLLTECINNPHPLKYT
jgi:aspartyl-tRNA(Asn)/glutamyl-tRNA(Gln) amidotransferase subunit A